MQLTHFRNALHQVATPVQLFLAASLLSSYGYSATVWTPGKYMSQAMAKVIAVGAVLESQSNYGWNGSGITMMGAFLQRGGTADFDVWLEGGRSYAFIGAGADSVSDLDLEIYDNGKRVVQDTKADATPVVEFRPIASRNYTMRLRLYASTSASFAAVALLQRGGFRVPIQNLADAYMNNVRMASSADTLMSARYHEQSNQWALYGQVLRPGEKFTVSNLAFEPGAVHYLLVTGDRHARDLDLAVQRDDRLIGRDEESDATPVVAINSSGGGHSFTVTNQDSAGPTLVIVSVLDGSTPRPKLTME